MVGRQDPFSGSKIEIGRIKPEFELGYTMEWHANAVVPGVGHLPDLMKNQANM